jgi:VWFA-related protein
VVVFDNFFTSVPGRLRALNRLQPFLEETLQGNAEVMIVSAGRRMGVALPFTDDPREVADVVGRVARVTTDSASRADQTDTLESLFEEALLEGRDTTGLESFAEALGFEERGEVMALLEMLGHVVDSLAGLEGRKAVLFVSDGFPVRPGDGPVFRNSVQSRYDVYDDLAELTRRANGNRVVFHTLRPAGLQTPIAGADVGRLSGRAGGREGVYDLARIDRTANTRSGLVDLATATGGRVLFEGNRIESFLDEVADDLTTYYSLGYRRPGATDRTRYRKIDVRVNRKGVEVLHRKGDFAKTASDALEDRVRSAALLGRASNELGLEIVVDRAIPLPDGRFQVPVLIPVPLDRVALLPRGDALAGGFRLLVGTVSTRGSMDAVQEFGYDVVVPARQMEGAGANRTYPAMFTLELPAGPVYLAVAFVDDHGSTPSIATGNFVLRREPTPAEAAPGG